MLEVLTARAPGLHEALVGLSEGDFVIVDGTLVPTDRIKADEPYYSRKHKQHGMNVQVVSAPDGPAVVLTRNAVTGPTTSPRPAPTESSKHARPGRSSCSPTGPTRAPAPLWLRLPGERAFAQLKSWRLLRRADIQPASSAPSFKPSTHS
jgi:hypothetical protein